MNSKNKNFKIEDIKNLKYFNIISQKIVKNIMNGINKSPSSGHSIEFKDYRKYNHGDDLKNIDWKLYGRTDKLFVKKYEKKTNINIYIFLDNSKSMDFGDKLTKILYSKYIASILAGVGLKQNDNIYLYSFNENLNLLCNKINNYKKINIVNNKLKTLKTKGKTRYKIIKNKIKNINDSLIFIISDFWSELENISNISKYSISNNNDTHFFHILSEKEYKFEFEGNVKFIDSENNNDTVSFNTNQVKKYYLKELKSRINKLDYLLKLQNSNYLFIKNKDDLFSVLYKYFMSNRSR